VTFGCQALANRAKIAPRAAGNRVVELDDMEEMHYFPQLNPESASARSPMLTWRGEVA